MKVFFFAHKQFLILTLQFCILLFNLKLLGHDEYPPKFDVDLETQMLGSVKPFRRQVKQHLQPDGLEARIIIIHLKLNLNHRL
jgi:hypothetical protein